MKKDQKFVLFVVLVIVAGFVGVSKIFKSNQESAKSEIPRISRELLVKDHSPTQGNKDAAVTVVEYLDPECEACKMMDPIVKGLIKEFDGKVFWVIRYMPFHGNSILAAVSLEEAREQGKYWESLSTLFYYQPQWGSHDQPNPKLIAQYLNDLGVRLPSEAELLKKHQWKVDLDQADGKAAGVQFTPTFFVNGRKLDDIGYEPIKAAIEKELAAQ